MRSARTLAEAQLFLELEPCECGELDTDWDVASVSGLVGGGTGVRFDGPCGSCGRVRTSQFALPDRVRHPPPGHFAFPEDAPSPLLDPAEWWALGSQYAEAAGGLADAVALDDDPGARAEVLALLTRSAAAADEVLRFLPEGAPAVPVEGFRTPLGRDLREREPESFTRSRLLADQAERWRGVDAFLAAHPESWMDTGTDQPGLAPDDAGRRLPLARSTDEAHLFLNLHPCACGESDFVRTVDSGEEDGGVWVLRYSGPCVSCGQQREFAFRQHEGASVPSGHAWADGTEHSELLDAGEWLWVADALLSAYPLDDDDLDAEEREALHRDLAMSAAAVDEVLKFMPAGVETVPRSAFWSARGRGMWAAQPGRFDRAALDGRRAAYLASRAVLDA
jgi:hypothetical protein